MKEIRKTPVYMFATVILFTMALYSCSDTTLGYEGRWSITDTLESNNILKTTLTLSGNSFEMKYTEKFDTSKIFRDILIQKGQSDLFAERLNLNLREYSFYEGNQLTSMLKFTYSEKEFTDNLEKMAKAGFLFGHELILTDTLTKFKFEVYNNKLHVIGADETYVFNRE